MSKFTDTLRSQARSALIAALLRLACRICAALPGQGCDPEHPDGEMIQLDSEPDLLVIHADRAADAVKARLVPRGLLLAQFANGKAPAALAGDSKKGTHHA